MLKILINSYTCCPNMGSEQGMGWNWIVNLAKYCEVFVVSEGEYRELVERWCSSAENSEIACNMRFFWNPVSDKVRKMCWNQGDWRFYGHYKEWQKKTADIARDICRKEKIDVLHQLNMIGFREPGYLWQVSKETGIPFVWGPIGGLKQFPMAYTDGGGLKMKIFNYIKNAINIYQIKYDKRVRAALHQASALISSIPDSYEAIKKYANLESIVIPETGCFVSDNVHAPFSTSQMHVLWVGKFDFRKRLDIALKAIAASNRNIKLFIYGTGSHEQVLEAEKLAEGLEIQDCVQFMGSCPNNLVKEAMLKADLFFFTSVSEDTSTVVLEAVSNKLPVLCFDTCGMAAVIDEKVGSKVSLTNPSQSVHDFADRLRYFYDNRVELQKRSQACAIRAEELSWDNKVRKMVDIYNSVII